MIVLDASVVVEWLAGGERERRVRAWLDAHEAELHVPDLLDVEVAQVMRRLALAGRIGSGRARAALDILAELPAQRHPARPLLPRIWALRENLTAYDATYVALAEALGAPLLTADARIAGAPGLATPIVHPDRAPGA